MSISNLFSTIGIAEKENLIYNKSVVLFHE